MVQLLPRQAQNIVERSIARSEREAPRCSLSSMAFLLSELVQYDTARCTSHDELVSRLMNAGFEVGQRAIEILNYRKEKMNINTRAMTVLEAVKQVSSSLWPYLFNKIPDLLQQDDQDVSVFYLFENSLQYTKFMSEQLRIPPTPNLPLDTPGYFVAGIVKGYLNSAGFEAEVNAVWKIQDAEPKRRSVIVIAFSKQTMEREQRLHR